MQICYHFLPGMIERGFGRIVNTTSGIALEAARKKGVILMEAFAYLHTPYIDAYQKSFQV